MAQRPKSGKELSFHKGSKRWCKSYTIDGVKKTKYFCHGNSVNDTTSYKKALKEYQAWWPQVQNERTVNEVAKRIGNYVKGILEPHRLGDSKVERQIKLVEAFENGVKAKGDYSDDEKATAKILAARSKVTNAEQESQQHLYAWARNQNRQHEQSAPDSTALKVQAKAWLQSEQNRMDAGEIGQSALVAKQQGIKTLAEFYGSTDLSNEKEVEKLLTDYRHHLASLVNQNKFKPNTANDKLKFMGQFMKWAYQHHVLKEMPRSLERASKHFPVEKGGHPLTAEQIHEIWDEASDRMRCFMCLGLNCGFKNKDVTSLTSDMIENGRLIGRRSKTGVLMNYKLWPITVEMIQANRQDRDQSCDALLFPNRSGNEISTTGISNEFKKVTQRAEVLSYPKAKLKSGNPKYATFEQLRDTSTQLAQQYLMGEGLDQSLLQVFLAHKDTSTAAYYTSNDPRQLNTTKLDQLIDHLDETFDLKRS